MPDETLEQKVNRLEFYVNLLRDIAVDPETYVFWDWIMSENLNENQAQQIMDVLRKLHRSIEEAEETDQPVPTLDDLSVKLIPVLQSVGIKANKKVVLRILRRASKMPIFNNFNRYL